jgi:hypothetical protein
MTTPDSKDTGGDVALGCAAVCLVPVAVAVEAFAAMKLWNWHLTAFGLQRISFGVAMGAIALYSLVVFRYRVSEKISGGADSLTRITTHIAAAAWCLLIGYIAFRLRGAA